MITKVLRGLHLYIVRNHKDETVGHIKKDFRSKVWEFKGNDRELLPSDVMQIQKSVQHLNR